MRTQHVGTDDKMLGRVIIAAFTHEAVPPFGGVGIAGEGVANPDDVVFGGIELPKGHISHLDCGQSAAAFKLKRGIKLKRMTLHFQAKI